MATGAIQRAGELPSRLGIFWSATRVEVGRTRHRTRSVNSSPPGGRVGILEITTPSGVLAPFYRVWFDRVVPLLGKVLPGGAAYTYLPASVRRFPAPDELADLLADSGFANVRHRRFAGGIVALHIGEAA